MWTPRNIGTRQSLHYFQQKNRNSNAFSLINDFLSGYIKKVYNWMNINILLIIYIIVVAITFFTMQYFRNRVFDFTDSKCSYYRVGWATRKKLHVITTFFQILAMCTYLLVSINSWNSLTILGGLNFMLTL